MSDTTASTPPVECWECGGRVVWADDLAAMRGGLCGDCLEPDGWPWCEAAAEWDHDWQGGACAECGRPEAPAD